MSEQKSLVHRSVIDAESGDAVVITAEMVAAYDQYWNAIKITGTVMSITLFLFKRDKLYLGGEFSSFGEFVEEKLPFGERSARRYVSLGSDLYPQFPQLAPRKRTRVSGPDETDPFGLERTGVNSSELFLNNLMAGSGLRMFAPVRTYSGVLIYMASTLWLFDSFFIDAHPRAMVGTRFR